MEDIEAISQRDAIDRLEDSDACDVITVDAATEIADAFDANFDTAPIESMNDVVPKLFGSSERGIAVADLVVTLVREVDETPVTPEFDGPGFTARARYEHNLPILYDHADLEIDAEPDIDWDNFEELRE